MDRSLRDSLPGYAAIESIATGADPHQVKVTFKQPYAQWRALFSPLYPAVGLPVTGGPLTLKSLDAKAGRASLVRNPQWWGDPVKVDGIDFLATPNRLDALDQGTVDVAALDGAVDSSLSALKHAEALPGLSLHRAAAPSFTQLTLNGARGPLAEPAVRRAVAACVDRRTVAEAALAPLGLPAVPLGNHLLMADQDGYQDDSGAIAATGRNLHLDLTLLLPEGSATAGRAADALVAQLAPAGITVHPKAVPADGFVRGHLAGGDWDLALFSWPATAFPAADERPLYAKPRPGADGRPVAGQNYGGWGRTRSTTSSTGRSPSPTPPRRPSCCARPTSGSGSWATRCRSTSGPSWSPCAPVWPVWGPSASPGRAGRTSVSCVDNGCELPESAALDGSTYHRRSRGMSCPAGGPVSQSQPGRHNPRLRESSSSACPRAMTSAM